MSTYTFDGCGISRDGRRILTGLRVYWDSPEFKEFCQAAVTALEMRDALREAYRCIMETPRSEMDANAWRQLAARISAALHGKVKP